MGRTIEVAEEEEGLGSCSSSERSCLYGRRLRHKCLRVGKPARRPAPLTIPEFIFKRDRPGRLPEFARRGIRRRCRPSVHRPDRLSYG